MREFIAHSPFLVMGTAGADGRCDVSPKGDAPGFVHVLDEHTWSSPTGSATTGSTAAQRA